MNKLKFVGASPTRVSTSESRFIVRLDKDGDCLSVRYFKFVDLAEVGDSTVADAMLPFNPTGTNLLRQTVDQHHLVNASVVSSHADAQGQVVRETGRHIFRPTIGASSVVGSGEKYDFPVFALPMEGDAVCEPYNHFVESANVKGEVNRNGRLRDGRSVFLLSSDNADAALDNWTIVFIESSSFILEDGTTGDWQTAPADFRAFDLLPDVEISCPSTVAPDGTVTASVTLKRGGSVVQYTGDMSAEALSGYLPHSRFTVTNGVGSFRASALGLQAGESMRVKVGTRVVSGLAEASISVA